MERQGRLRRKPDHGDLTGLADNDHTQYVNAVSDTSSINLTLTGQSISGVAVPGGIDHGGLAGLGDDDHPQYIKDSEFTQNSGFLVGTGAGTFQEETANVARTSLNLGTGDSPTFIGLTLSGLTQGSVLFAGAGGVISEDNDKLFWDATNIRLGIGTDIPLIDVDIRGSMLINGGTGGATTVPASGVGFLATYDTDGSAGATSGGSGVAFFTSYDWDVSAYRDLWFNASKILFRSNTGKGIRIENKDGTGNAVALTIDQQDPAQWSVQVLSSPTNGFGVYILSPVTNSNAALRIDNNSGEVFRITNAGNMGLGETAPETLTEWTHAQPYLTLHNSTHEDTDGGRESRFNFKGEQSGGEETTLARIEVSHDGSGDDQLGRIIDYVNTGAGLVEAMRIDSDLLATFAGNAAINGLRLGVTVQTDTDYTALATDDFILVSTGATTRTITLPASPPVGKIYHIKKIDSGIGLVTIDGNGNNIDDDATPDITAQYESFSIVFGNSEWNVF